MPLNKETETNISDLNEYFMGVEKIYCVIYFHRLLLVLV